MVEVAMMTQLEIDTRRRLHTSMMEAKLLGLTVQLANLEELFRKVRGAPVEEPILESLAKL